MNEQNESKNCTHSVNTNKVRHTFFCSTIDKSKICSYVGGEVKKTGKIKIMHNNRELSFKKQELFFVVEGEEEEKGNVILAGVLITYSTFLEAPQVIRGDGFVMMPN